MKASERVIYQIDVSDHDAESFVRAIDSHQLEGLVLKLTSDRRVDIGALCYTKRNFKPGIPTSVEINTLSYQRCIAIKSWCLEVATGVFIGESPYSVYGKALGLRGYLNWCDENGDTACLERDDYYKKSLNEYTEHLFRLTHNKLIEESTAHLRQHMALQYAEVFFPNSHIDFSSDLPLLFSGKRAGSSQKQATDTPEENEIGKYLAASQDIFDGLTDFLTTNTPYPHRIAFLGRELVILPLNDQFFTHSIITRNETTQRITGWNLSEARRLTATELMSHRSCTKNRADTQAIRSKEKLDAVNSDKHHLCRIALARHAQNAFYCLFLANTAMNESAARQLRWSIEYDVSNSTSVGFIVIKYRAGNLEQHFEIKKSFLKHFQKYLKLRSYLHEVKASDYLFPSYSYSQVNSEPTRSGTVLYFGKYVLSKLDSSIKVYTSRQLRKYKAVYLLSRNHSVATVSALIQNSPASTIKSYTEAAEKTAIDEISTTIRFITELLDQRLEYDTPVGKCSGSMPEEALPAPESYEPDCKNFAGCLFCENFAMPADEESIRKILSMRHVIFERISLCTDVDQFYRLHGATLDRINYIISELQASWPELQIIVDKVKQEIEDECELSDYWLLMYERLIKLKMV